jgi:hypothetical protein
MKKLATMVVLLATAGAAAASLLVRVDLAPGQDIEAVAASGVDVLLELNGWCLARGDDAGAARLAERFDYTVLDRDPEAKRYVYAETDPGFDRRRLAEFGSVLTEDRTGVLLRTTEDGIKGMNRLPVELCGVSMNPIYIGQTLSPKPETPNPGAVSDSLIWLLVGRASRDSAEATLRRLISFRTRYAYTESCWSAARWFQSKLVAYGCDTTYLDTFQSALGPNIVGVKRGRVNPNRIYIICGHVDNTSEIPYDYAPGSDDNASGAGLVLEAARVFADMDFDYTVWFIGFSGEEQGLVGSDSFARHCRERGDTIVLTINHDMDSYGTAGRDSIRVVGKRSNPPCSTWVEFYMAQADTFTDLKCHREIVDEQSSSDQASFWKYGYAAIRDRYLDRDPVYHTTGDTIGPFEYYNCGTNNIPMYTEAIKATVATVAKLAGPHPRTGVEEGRKPQAAGLKLTASPSVFRSETTIRVSGSSFVLPRSSLSIYDASGRLVRALSLPQSPTPDPYPLTWDGTTESGARAAPGVYYARLGQGDDAAPVRLVLAE